MLLIWTILDAVSSLPFFSYSDRTV